MPYEVFPQPEGEPGFSVRPVNVPHAVLRIDVARPKLINLPAGLHFHDGVEHPLEMFPVTLLQSHEVPYAC